MTRFIGLRIVGLVVVLFMAACSKTSPSEPPLADTEPIVASAAGAASFRLDPAVLDGDRIRTEAVVRRALDDEILASGEVVPAVDGEAYVGAMISGRVAGVLVKAGEAVTRGQVLAWIDAPEAARMQGDLLRARASLWRAEQRLEQERVLWKDKATSERALREAEAEVRAAKADQAAVRGLLAAARVPIPREDARQAGARIGVTSPIAGIVSRRLAVVGSHVGPEDNLFEIVDPAKLLVRADVDEIAARRVLPDAKALIHPRGEKEGCLGKVRSKLEVIDPTKRTMGIMIEVSAACANLASGGFADVSVTLAPSQGALSVVVPRSAVVDLDGATVVFVESPSAERGTFEVRNVSLGFSDGDSVVIEEGLREGERIAVVGAFLLKGERMKPGSGE